MGVFPVMMITIMMIRKLRNVLEVVIWRRIGVLMEFIKFIHNILYVFGILETKTTT